MDNAVIYSQWSNIPVAPFLVPVVLTAVLFFASRAFVHFNNHFDPLPPGPRQLPIVGNYFDVPSARTWLKYAEWGAQYGTVIHVRLFKESVIVLNTLKAADDLLVKMSSVMSERPKSTIMAGELVGWDRGVAMAPAGSRHRMHRKLMNMTLSPAAVRALSTRQEQSAQSLVKAIEREPERYLAHIKNTVGINLVKLTYGNVLLGDDALCYIGRQDKSHEVFIQTATPYSFAVDYFPALRFLPEWFPGAGFKRYARNARLELEELVSQPYEAVKRSEKHLESDPFFVAKCLDQGDGQSITPEHEAIIAWTAISLYTGGVDTTEAAVRIFLHAMSLYPEVQRRAQREIDTLLADKRSLVMSDREHLPYTNVLVQEVLRWRPIAPLGVAHRASESIMYNGHRIPAGATVFSNIWAIMHDPEVYSNPEEFQPERFLPPKSEPACTSIAFGFGRRICPGMHFADAGLFIYAASILAAFDVSPTAANAEVEYTTGLLSFPRTLRLEITPRHVKSGDAE